jgi:multimeric flavodoxin WrbA
MKVIAVNGSPKANGNTYNALSLVGSELQKQGIDFEILHIGNKLIHGCLACGACAKNLNERCVIDDEVNDCLQKLKNADGILLGSPVHYAGIAGTMKSFLDRLFYVAGANGGLFRHKVGAAVIVVRRSGGVFALDSLNHYINYAEMFMPGSNYWNVAHGREPGEMLQDLEGQQIMRVLGKNMAWLLQVIAAGKSQVPESPKEAKVVMNFVR